MSNQDLFTQKILSFKSIDQILEVKKEVIEYHTWLQSEFTQQPISKLVLGRALYVDHLIQHLWRILDLENVEKLSLIAVGGYGRGHLNLHSDIDLLILSNAKLNDINQQKVSAFITALWDIGLDVGQSVRTLQETISLGKEDITIATNLLEARYLIGDEALFNQLTDKVSSQKFWSSTEFFQAKLDEQLARRAKFNDTSYNLEPNIKENPGCLRDIQTIGWIAKKHYKAFDGNQLVEHGFMTDDELRELQDCREFLWHMRFALHMVAGRSENRLLFEHQPAVADLLGYGQAKSDVETMMRKFFVIVRRIGELNQVLLQYFSDKFVTRFRPWKRKKINDEFEICNGLLKAKHDHVFDTPEKLLNLFQIIADAPNINALHSTTLRQLRNARRKYESIELCQIESCRDKFLTLIAHRNFFGLSWQLMHRHGVMAIYSKAWAHIVGLMQFDLFHTYTVDEHTHRLIKNIFRYTEPEHKHEFPRCTTICQNFAKLELLYIAAIFHDICKGKGGDHSELGAVEVRAFCKLHNISKIDTDLVAWLVENHLLMSAIAQRKDINDPQVIYDFCQRVRDETHLNLLYALTFADIRATNAGLLNDWKASLLRQLYTSTLNAFRSGLEEPVSKNIQISDKRESALIKLSEANLDKQKAQAIWQNLPPEYFLRYSAKQIAWHTKALLHSKINHLIVSTSNETHLGGTAIFIYVKDRADLFASICSSLDRKNFTIHDANIMNTDDGYALDTFIVLEEDGNQVNKKRFKDIHDAIEEAAKNKIKSSINHKIPRQIKQFKVPTLINWVGHKSDKRSLMELEALDTPGLLVKIGRVFFKNNITIHAAKVATIGERAEDFFILTNNNGDPLTVDEKESVTQQLREALHIQPSN